MNIHEHQAKDLLKEFGAPVPKGVVVTVYTERFGSLAVFPLDPASSFQRRQA